MRMSTGRSTRRKRTAIAQGNGPLKDDEVIQIDVAIVVEIAQVGFAHSYHQVVIAVMTRLDSYRR